MSRKIAGGHDVQKICWICNTRPADSCEHSTKKSIITRSSNNGFAKFYTGTKKAEYVQGPGSYKFKYGSNICQQCNTTNTQPHDRAFDLLYNWYRKNANPNNTSLIIDFTKLYSDDYKLHIKNLLCFFAKNLGCRLIDNGLKLMNDFPNPITGCNLDRMKTSMCSAYYLDIDTYKDHETIFLNSDLYGLKATIQGEERAKTAIWQQNFGSLQINYRYNTALPPFLGAELIPDAYKYTLNLVSSPILNSYNFSEVPIPLKRRS